MIFSQIQVRCLAISPAWLQLFGQAGQMGLAHLVHRGAFMLLFLLFAREFAPGVVATIGFANVAIMTLIGAFGVGAGPIAVRHFARRDLGDPNEWQNELHALAWLVLLASLFAALLYPVLLPGDQRAALLLFPLAAVAVSGSVAAAALNGLQAYDKLLLHSVLAAGAMLSIGLAAIWMQSIALGFVALVAGIGIKALADLRVAIRAWPEGSFRMGRPARGPLMRLLRSVLWLGGAGALSALGLWGVAKLVIERLGDVVFAEYLIGMQWYALGAFAVGQLTRVVMPIQVHAATRGERPRRFIPLLLIAVALTLMITLAAWLARDLISLAYGDRLAEMGHFVWLFMLASISVAPANMIGNQLIAEGREWGWLVATLGWAGLLALGLFSLIGTGLLGVLQALVAANIFLIAIALFYVFRRGRA